MNKISQITDKHMKTPSHETTSQFKISESMLNDGIKSDTTTLYASICEESSFQVKKIWNVATNDKSHDWDENMKIMECSGQGDEVIIARMRKISL